MEEVVAVAKVWGVLMVGFFQPIGTDHSAGPFVDVNYQTMEACELTKSELL